ncbi:unnamed protein product [Adineta steineri]|uniref:NHL repeat containing protein n=1 Tax=Adineta steineri TaxID=433720 RepID=A0A815W0P4_9BILA|nr:unnamed protein product [Adineta steineri]CAF1537422.1 unnamed protein product [Adineta steineri]
MPVPTALSNWDVEVIQPSSITKTINPSTSQPANVQLNMNSLPSIASSSAASGGFTILKMVMILISVIIVVVVVAIAIVVPTILLGNTVKSNTTTTASIVANGTTASTTTVAATAAGATAAAAATVGATAAAVTVGATVGATAAATVGATAAATAAPATAAATAAPATAAATAVPATAAATAAPAPATTEAATAAPATTEAATTVAAPTTGNNSMYWNTTASSRAGTGTSGPGLNQLNSSTGIFFDSSDNLYVADSGNYRVLKYAPGVTIGTVIAGTTNVSGTTLDLFSTGIRYIFVDSSQNLYVADTYNNRVMLWPNGASTGTIVAGNATFGTSFNQIYNPYGIWVDSSSNVYVAEYQNQRVTKWASGATTGILLAGNTSSAGNITSKLASPAGLVYDALNQDLYIANSATSTSTVLKWHIGDHNATVVAGTPGSPGNSSTQLSSPMGIALDPWNNLYVADRSNNRVQLFCNGNTTGITIAGNGAGGTTLSAPYDVKLDSKLNLYVSLNSGARVRKFNKL